MAYIKHERLAFLSPSLPPSIPPPYTPFPNRIETLHSAASRGGSSWGKTAAAAWAHRVGLAALPACDMPLNELVLRHYDSLRFTIIANAAGNIGARCNGADMTGGAAT